MSIWTALKYCLVIFSYSFLAGLLYNVVYYRQKAYKYGKIGCFIGDLLAMGLLGAGIIWLIIDLGGVFRWYVLGAAFLGVISYYFLLHRIILRLYKRIGRGLSSIWHICTWPLQKIRSCIKKSYKKVKKNQKKIAQTSGNYPEDAI